MKLPGTGLDAEILGYDTPASALVCSVLLEHNFHRLLGNFSHTKTHISVAGPVNTPDYCLYLRRGCIKVSAKPYLKVSHIRLSLHIHACDKAAELAVS
ncbi:MAG TPA: hypothetical protein DD713_05745 [Nitrospiraceae bacterium]|nr:hypothetical protein [Nitrospiraceae bacterium]